MKGLLKTAAILMGLAGGVGVGFLINLALTGIADFSLALLVVVAILFVGGFALAAVFILLWAKANGDLDNKPVDTQEIEQTDNPKE